MLIELLIALITLLGAYLLFRRTRASPLRHLSPKQRQLFEAVGQQDLQLVQTLVTQQNVDVNTKTYAGMNVLFFAVEKGTPGLVQFLIEHGVEVNLRADNGDTPLRRAIYRNHIEATRLLLDASAGVNEMYRDKKTPLIVAVERNSYAMVGLLLKKGASWHALNEPVGASLLSKSLYEIQSLVQRYRAWDDSKKILFAYKHTSGRRPNLPEDLLRVVISYLSSEE